MYEFWPEGTPVKIVNSNWLDLDGRLAIIRGVCDDENGTFYVIELTWTDIEYKYSHAIISSQKLIKVEE